MGKTKRAAKPEKKDRKYSQLEKQIAEQLKEIKLLKQELKEYKDTGAVPVVKEKVKKLSAKEEKEKKKEEILERMKEWRRTNHGEYVEE